MALCWGVAVARNSPKNSPPPSKREPPAETDSISTVQRQVILVIEEPKLPRAVLAALVCASGAQLQTTLDLNGVVRCATIEEIEAEKSSIEKDVKARMERTIDMVRTNFNSVRTGRSNPAMLDKIEVEYYGSPVSLKSIAQINTPDSSSLLIQPYDKSRYPMLRTDLKSIEKAIVSSDLGMTPNNDGEVIRLTLPQLTSERRKELSKVVAKQAEEGKEKKLSEDNVKDLSSDLQKLTDEYMKKIDSIYKQKEKQPVTLFTGNTEE
ncbi:Ribosome-recycling factor [Citrus sinensis]|uniref:Ribosome-recycling factor n=1 Tax=Citrus sinensis TaxID=2711 RepID=A0ACB8ML05_CITSI|nr:Ribosome-recycling factor [Citrus sinensis]